MESSKSAKAAYEKFMAEANKADAEYQRALSEKERKLASKLVFVHDTLRIILQEFLRPSLRLVDGLCVSVREFCVTSSQLPHTSNIESMLSCPKSRIIQFQNPFSVKH